MSYPILVLVGAERLCAGGTVSPETTEGRRIERATSKDGPACRSSTPSAPGRRDCSGQESTARRRAAGRGRADRDPVQRRSPTEWSSTTSRPPDSARSGRRARAGHWAQPAGASLEPPDGRSLGTSVSLGRSHRRRNCSATIVPAFLRWTCGRFSRQVGHRLNNNCRNRCAGATCRCPGACHDLERIPVPDRAPAQVRRARKVCARPLDHPDRTASPPVASSSRESGGHEVHSQVARTRSRALSRSGSFWSPDTVTK